MAERPEDRERHEAPKTQDSPWRYAGLGFEFLAALMVGLFLGQWIDQKLGSEPWAMIIGVFSGGAAAIYDMYRRSMAELERDRSKPTR